jgi:hypothetical protein
MNGVRVLSKSPADSLLEFFLSDLFNLIVVLQD